ncbi:MAG: 4-(cytidine 5'-diphospho)-2-C-methyl-D-erythritol kinase [Planctomycetes bacterium]|nr:4-(cytidine 5'-diphospho)-2-C-methyl-D-erythritol kinase [Planctomycetota bacterium]
MDAVRVLAPAKINPRLEVLGRRADGYHELATFLVAVEPCDEIRIFRTTRGAVRLLLSGEHASADVPADTRNLAARAAELVLEHARKQARVRADTGLDVHVAKRIPSQSGLGGASSDAAAAWLAACTILDVAMSPDERDAQLATLGSDVVFFARAADTGAAWCTGRGEIVAPARAPTHWSIVLITPRVASPTAAVYAQLGFHLRAAPPVSTVRRTDWFSTEAHAARALLGNDLEPAAFTAVPELVAWRDLFDALGASHFRLSGSGSSFFGLYEGEAAARQDLARIAAAARDRRMESRFSGSVRPTGHGVRICPLD